MIKYDKNNKLLSSEENNIRVVVGLDFGTTYTGFAYCHVSDEDNICSNDSWNGDVGQLKTNTVLQYDNEYNNVKLWGAPALAKKKSRRTRKQKNSENNKPIELFKLHLGDLLDEFKPKLPVDYKKAITDYLREIGKVIKETIDTRWPNIDYFENVLLVITVPAEFSDKAKAIMRICAFDAELIREKYSKNLQFTTEPEAAAIYCMSNLEGHDLTQAGTNFMIVDCGGGTVDLTTRDDPDFVYEVDIRDAAPILEQHVIDDDIRKTLDDDEWFSSQVDIISVPTRPIAAISRGAAIYGLSIRLNDLNNVENDECIISSRVLKYTYGISYCTKWKEGDPENRKKHGDLIEKFHRLAERGTKTDINREVTKYFAPVDCYQTQAKHKLYYTQAYDAEYCDEHGVNLLGELCIELPGSGLDRRLIFGLTFGNMEITATSKNERTGQRCNTTFKFNLEDKLDLVLR
ncbi:unnamed protein product [Rhizophagus irregularis]|uniref:Actin-like ATPase domain-containing protein n=1 Tax=Rhizophagus irregularis TaxID=588596 RepID=A0A915ZNQ2_9GLOM|nr:unnamed protein product [Rhizophagus irregularis]